MAPVNGPCPAKRRSTASGSARSTPGAATGGAPAGAGRRSVPTGSMPRGASSTSWLPSIPAAPVISTLPPPPAMGTALAVHAVRAAARHERRGLEQGIEGPGVRPPALEHLEGHRAVADVPVVDVGDLELAALGGLQGLDDLEDPRVVHVDADHGQVGDGVLGLLLDRQHAVALELGHPEAVRVVDLLEHDLRAPALVPEVGHAARDVALDDVVAEDHA